MYTWEQVLCLPAGGSLLILCAAWNQIGISVTNYFFTDMFVSDEFLWLCCEKKKKIHQSLLCFISNEAAGQGGYLLPTEFWEYTLC